MVALTIVLYDAMASGISRFSQIDYSYFAFGSILLFFLAGFVVSWRLSFLMGILAGIAAGFFDPTVGWAVSSWIGPTSSMDIPYADLTPGYISVIVVGNTLLAGVIGLTGSGIASLLKRLTPQQIR